MTRYTVDVFCGEDFPPENIVWKEPMQGTRQYVVQPAHVAKHATKDGFFYVVRAMSLKVPKTKL
jgi:hypothetical protein